jgi:hypothetical protein
VARVSLVIVLAEDERTQRLIYRYLQLLNYAGRDIRFEPLPGGQGSGEAWVRTRYPQDVRAYRARAARAESSLVAAIDADVGDVGRRIRQLDESLTAEGLSQRTAGERIVHLIPKRNIETWIFNLNSRPVDEETDFSRAAGVDEMITSAARTLFEWTRLNAIIPPHCVPSLRLAIEELKRLE